MRIKKIAAGNGPFFRKKLGPVVNVVAPPLQLSKFKYQSYSFLCKMFLEKNEKNKKICDCPKLKGVKLNEVKSCNPNCWTLIACKVRLYSRM